SAGEGGAADGDYSASLPRDQVKRARGRRAEGRVKRIVAHRKVLGVIPVGGGGIAVVITHHEALAFSVVETAAAAAQRCWKQVHQTQIKRHLLRSVVVVLVAGCSLAVAQTKRVDRIRGVGRIAG